MRSVFSGAHGDHGAHGGARDLWEARVLPALAVGLLVFVLRGAQDTGSCFCCTPCGRPECIGTHHGTWVMTLCKTAMWTKLMPNISEYL